MPILEQDALRVANSLGQLDETARKEAGALLNAYLDQQEKLGAPLWPSIEEQKKQQHERARDIIYDPLQLDKEDGTFLYMDELNPGSGQQFRNREAAQIWTATKFGADMNDVRERWSFYKAELGEKWGTGVLDDTAFFSRAKQEQQKEDARIDLYKSAQDAAFQSAIAGGDDLADFGNWQATQDNEEAWQDATHQIWSKTRREIAEAIGPNRELIANAPEAMRRLQTGAATDADRETLDRLAWTVTDATGKQRQVMLRALAHGVRSIAEEQGKQGVGATFTVSAERLVEDMFGGGRIGESTAAKLDPTQPLRVGPITNLDDATRALDTLAKAEFAERVPFDPDAPQLPEARQLSPEEQALMQQAKERVANLFKTERELKRLARESTPLDDGFLGTMASGTATSLSLIAPALLGPGGAVLVGGGYANMEYEQLLTEYPDMSAEDAARVAVLSGGIQAALDKATLFGLDKFSPNLRKLLTGNATRELVKQAVGKTAGLVTFENVVEGLQDLTTPVVQDVISDLKNTVPAVDWDREFTEFADSRADVFIGMLPLMLIGAGVNTARNREQAKALLSDNDALARAGYIESDRIAAIEKAQAGDVEGAAAVLEEGFDRRSPELAAEMGNEQGAKAINDWQTVRQAAEAGVIPRIRRDGNGWAVEQNGAFVKVGSRDEALQIALSSVDENARTEAEALAKVAEAYSSGQDVVDLQLGTVRRLQDEGLSEQQVREFAVAEGMVNGLTREEAEQATWYVLGKNQLETKEGVRRAVVSLYRGASVLDAVEEPVEARLKLAWESGALTREQTLDWIRTAAEIMGAPELVTAAESGNNGMIEAVSDIVLADVFGQRRDGRKGVAGAVTAGIKAKLRQNVTSKTASQFGQFLAAFRAFFAQVFRRARALAKARKEGRIGEDFDAFLDTVMGTPAQQRFEAETVKEGFAMLQDMMPNMPALEGQPYSFSLSRVTPQQDAEYLAAVQAGDMETAQRLVDEAARAAGYNVKGWHGTKRKFNEFQLSKGGEWGSGIYAAPRKETAELFGSYQPDSAPVVVMKVFLKILNPLITSDRNVPRGKGIKFLMSKGFDGVLGTQPNGDQQFVVFSPSQIKSADPITYDDAGNVIPLSQRFNPETPNINFSLSRNPVDVADTFLAQRMRSPEFREIYFNAARDRLARLRKTKSWQAAQEPDASRKERQLAALKTLDTLLMAFPPEVRGRVGGFVKLASFETDAARAREIERRLEKLDVVVEEAAKKHYGDIIADLFKRYAPGKDDKGRITSKLTPDAAADVAFAKEFSELEPAKQDETIAGIEKILAESEDSTEIQDAIGRLGITQLFQRLDEQESAQLETAANWLQGIVTGAREARRVLDAARAEYIKEAKSQAKLDASNGKFSELPDAENLEADIRGSTWKTFSTQIKGLFNAALFQVGQQLENVFGAESRITTEFHKRAVRAANQSTDLKIDIERRRQKAANRIFKTESRVIQAGKMGLLQKPRQSGVFINVGGKTQKVEVPADVVRRLIAGEVTPQSMDLQAGEVDLLKAQYDEEQAKPGNKRKRVFTLERPSVGRSTELKMSEDEGIQYLLWSRQQASREQLERDGWTEESFKQLEQFLSPEAQALADFIADEYERLGNLIAPVYERLFHAPFPRVRNYAPIYRDITSADSIIDIEQQGMGSGLSSGFVLARNKNARSALRRTSAVSAFLQHAESAAHWISHVELVRDMRSILADKEVQNAIRAAGRSASANGLKKRIKQLENKGTLQAAGIAEIDGWFSKMLQAKAFKALAFKISPVIKQTSAFFNPLLGDVPAWEYMRGVAKLMSGQLDVKAMWDSPDIQRRLLGGFSAEARIAMEGLGYSRAGPIGQTMLALLSKGMLPMQFMDAGWTSAGAAISFDYYKRQNMKAGMNETQAENEARQQLEMLIAETAQPADAANRALIEGISNPWLKSMWMFASESRKTLAVEVMALKRLATGKSKNIGLDLQRAIVAHVLMAATTQLMSGVLAMLMGDADDREREWSAEEWAAAIIAGPLNGLFVFGDLIEYGGRRAFGLHAFEPKTPIAQSATAVFAAPKAVEDLIDGDPEEQRRALFKLSEAIGTAAAFTPVGAANPFTAADVILGNSLKDVDKILTRLDE